MRDNPFFLFQTEKDFANYEERGCFYDANEDKFIFLNSKGPTERVLYGINERLLPAPVGITLRLSTRIETGKYRNCFFNGSSAQLKLTTKQSEVISLGDIIRTNYRGVTYEGEVIQYTFDAVTIRHRPLNSSGGDYIFPKKDCIIIQRKGQMRNTIYDLKRGDLLEAIDNDSDRKTKDIVKGETYIFACYDDKYVGIKLIDKGDWTYAYTKFKKVEKTNGGAMKDFKEYLSKHKELLYTVGILIVLDQLVFKGAFRERLKTFVEGLIGKAQASLDKPEAKEKNNG